MQQPDAPFDPAAITRPEPALLTYYTIVAAMTVLGFPFVFIPLYFKYHTLRYKLDDHGIAMSYGILFRRESYLTYRRIQDIHLTRNLVQRWLGLASVAVQTASGSSRAEMVLDGVRAPEDLRDFLYRQMRGARHDGTHSPAHGNGVATPATSTGGTHEDEVFVLLRQIRDEVQRLREALESNAAGR